MRRRGRVATVLLAGALLVGAPALAQSPSGTSGSFSYYPTVVQRNGTIHVSGHCLWGGSAQGVSMAVNVIYKIGSPGGDHYSFGEVFIPAADGSVAGSISVPSDAMVGDYVISSSCVLQDQVFFSESGPLTVTGPGPPNQPPPDRPRPTTTTSVAQATTTTSVRTPITAGSKRTPTTRSSRRLGSDSTLPVTNGESYPTTSSVEATETSSPRSAARAPLPASTEESPVRNLTPFVLVGGLAAAALLAGLMRRKRRV